MKISLNWLSDYVDLPASADELAARLTMAGLEVEAIERLGGGLEGVVVAQILESAQHPNAEKLSVTRVDAGAKGVLQVVCGAKNYKVGDRVPLATVGTKLPGGVEIQKAKLRGVESFGMLCSARELAISEDASGLLILDPALPVGQDIADALALRDVVFEINVTPNRSDCLSHLGIAREVAALYGVPLRLPTIEMPEGPTAAASLVSVDLQDPERCPRYAARVIEGVTIGPSPAWMQNRLRAVGVRAISNAVDVTNFVLLECGQPLHAFDLDRVAEHRIVVRRAGEGEKMATLDGKERVLSADDLCICDAKSPSALAGVMGGATSEVSPQTKRILVESAWFQPAGVRRTARRHALHTEASHRFERGVDPGVVLFAQDRATALLAQLCGGQVAAGRVDACPRPPQPRTLKLRFAKVREVLGAPVTADETRRVLQALAFDVGPGEQEAEVRIPSWRLDVEGEADCIEEVARVRGYDRVQAVMPRGPAELPPESPRRAAEVRLRQALAASGFDEVVNYSFVARRDLEVLTPAVKPLALRNPLSAEQAVMCTTRLAGLLGNLKRSLNRQVEDVRLYEIGRVYLPSSDRGQRQPADEPQVLAGVLAGARAPVQWGQARQPVDFFDLKGALEQVIETLGIEGARFTPAEVPMLHPRSACELRVGAEPVGILGELHPQVAQRLDLPRGVFVFEIRVEPLVAGAQLRPRFKGVPRFPAVLRDIAVVLGRDVPAVDVLTEVRAAGGGLVEDATLFDDYRGANIPADRKSLALAIRFRAADRTLTDEETNRAQAAIVARLVERFGGELRSS